MDRIDTPATIAARLQAAWQAGRICSLIGAGCHARVLRIGRLVDSGRLDAAEGLRLARESEGIAYFFAPLPAGGRP